MRFTIGSNVANALMACIAKNDSREDLCGIHIDVSEEGNPVAVATDGHSMLVAPIVVDDVDDVPEAGLVLPRSSGDVAFIDTSVKLVRWNGGRKERVGAVALTSTNTYPDWRFVLTAEQDNVAKVSRVAFRFELVARIERELSRGLKQPLGSRLSLWSDGNRATVEFDGYRDLKCVVMGYRWPG